MIPVAEVVVEAKDLDPHQVSVGFAARTDDGVPTHGGGVPKEDAASRRQKVEAVRKLGVPLGVAEQFATSARSFAMRYWILDNSGSMQTADGHKFISNGAGREGVVTCSRWDELGAAMEFHAKVAVALGAPTEFRVLNPPAGSLSVARAGFFTGDNNNNNNSNENNELAAVRRLAASRPTGRTPLCAQIRQVIMDIRAQEAVLRREGRKACVVVASDGEATDGDVGRALEDLRDLPVWVVVRLCTDEDSVVNYWNSVDDELELDVDVLDDLAGEARQVASFAPWLTYAEPLHRLREWGTNVKLLDIIDERKLSKHELLDLAAVLLGEDVTKERLPHPDLNWPTFLATLDKLQRDSGLVWCPIRNERRPWFSIKKLKRHYSPAGCVIA